MKKTLLATLFASVFVLTSPTLYAKTYGETSIEELKSEAAAGDATAMSVLGSKYSGGIGVKEDDAEAVNWFRKAAERNVESQHNLGIRYANGEGVKEDDAEAVKWYRKAAEQGLAEAQCNLGVMYANGEGVKKDDAEAVKWYRKAAEQGFATAQSNLGVEYDKGEGVKEDDAEAVKWYRKAAEQGHVAAQYNLGIMYANGAGIKKDDTEALKWYKKAAEQNHENAKRKVYLIGSFAAETDPEKAKEQASILEKLTAYELLGSKSDTDSSKSAKSSDQYTDNGDGTVTDTKTKLMWKQCSEGQNGKDCSGDAAKYKWDDAMSKFGKGVSFAGHSDWRMPTKEELRGLVYCSNGTPQEEAWDEMCAGKDKKAGNHEIPTINQKVFPNTGVFYWSSTEQDSSYAWDVDFGSGDDDWDDRRDDDAVRLVRSGQ